MPKDEYEIRKERAERTKKAKEEQAEKIAQEKQKKCYDVREETVAPVTVFYKVWAYSPKEAADMVERKQVLPSNISKPKLVKSIPSEIYVYIAGTINKVFYKKR